MQRFFLYLAYDGAAYHGWQIQPSDVSVQETLMQKLSMILRQQIEVVGAGRTDAEVNAKLMVAHFDYDDTDKPITGEWITDKLNRVLPRDIAIYKTVPVKPEAHARFDATSRTYHYFLHLRKNPFFEKYSYRYVGKLLDFAKMNEAAKILFEYSDFTSFSKLHTDTKTNICKLMKAEWTPLDDGQWRFEIQADRFLRNMVRSVVGTLIDVGCGRLDIDGFRRVVEGKDRCLAGTSVPGNALFLVDITYPDNIF
ncbi:MAG: tRNA pseudouridine(38-40) synthase TruA [Bacteroidaceae bacterium]|nr:tRNA pseudouridine(38-40) synthase TruA [Bacteroidaceae bacterium]